MGALEDRSGAVSESSVMSLPARGRVRMLLWFLPTTQQGGKAVGRGQAVRGRPGILKQGSRQKLATSLGCHDSQEKLYFS